MESTKHTFPDLFKQLGLPDDAESIDKFITTHSPLKLEIKLVDAPFWSEPQRAFLREAVLDDADWAVPFDELNEALRHPRK